MTGGARDEVAAGFLRAAAGVFLVVDRCHPFAATIDRDGRLVDTTSWSELIPPPRAWHWPRRRLLHLDPTRFGVHDVGHTAAALLQVAPDGTLTADRAPLQQLSWEIEQFLPMWAQRSSADPGPGWVFGTDSRRTRWCWWAVHPGVVRPTFGPDGSVVAHAALDEDTALAGIQRTNKRPFRLAAPTSLRLFDTGRNASGYELAPVPIPHDARWHSATSADPDARAAALAAYRRITEGQRSVLADAGRTDVEVTVYGDGPATRIVLEFGSPTHPGRRFRRIDHPFDELGNRGGGLHDMAVLLDEDLAGGLLDELVARDPQRTLIDV